jgi:hypothetical protein
MKCGKPVSRPANRAGRNFNEGVIDVMLESILWSLGIAMFLGVVVGIPYIKGVEPKKPNSPTNKREYVLANLDKFGCKD